MANKMADKKKSQMAQPRSVPTAKSTAREERKEQAKPRTVPAARATAREESKEQAKKEPTRKEAPRKEPSRQDNRRRDTRNASPSALQRIRNSRVGRFLAEAYYELRHKVTWPTFIEARNMTFVVIALSVVVGLLLWLVDSGLTSLFLAIGR